MGQALVVELRQLQSIELQLTAIRRDRESRTRRVEAQRRLLKQIDDKLETQKRTIRERQMKADALSLDIASREEAIDHHRQALNKAKTNKEYAAILAAMNIEKADNAKIETSALQIMEEVQALKAEGAKIEEEKAKIAQDLANAEQAVKEFDDRSRAELDSLKKRRGEFARTVSPEVMASFDRCAARNEGEALAPITKLHPRRDEYTCGGCNMQITLQVVNALQTHDDLQVCRVCGRILYLDDPAHFTRSKS